MKPGIKVLFLLSGCLDNIIVGSALKCWKCIAHDCNSDLEGNYKASKVKCHEGQRCMKVRYRMFDNVTHYDSVIRTCTDNKCDSSSLDSFYSCVATPTKYMIGGCTLRLCCDDRDLCNFSDSTVSVSFISVILAGFTTLLLGLLNNS
ncbi:uncharacterized protein LOC123530977 [Mercenaria mercenaria]|uniref:uncharacterized protein LOC123530977 n=1 Tax=Mercenaria mercenaria TaxID=6596 RepID=UPI00234F7466|nr:uncharacterized protein LOC123530977 [Mercenaria mercenaria]